MEPKGAIENFLMNFPKIVQNEQPIQSVLSNVCGQYCIYILYFLSKGKSFNFIINTLNKYNNSDTIVKIFVEKMVNKF